MHSHSRREGRVGGHGPVPARWSHHHHSLVTPALGMDSFGLWYSPASTESLPTAHFRSTYSTVSGSILAVLAPRSRSSARHGSSCARPHPDAFVNIFTCLRPNVHPLALALIFSSTTHSRTQQHALLSSAGHRGGARPPRPSTEHDIRRRPHPRASSRRHGCVLDPGRIGQRLAVAIVSERRGDVARRRLSSWV